MHSIVIADAVSFELSNGRVLFTEINASLEPKITALIGPNGIGKTTLAKLLAGELSPTRGVVRRNGAIRFLPQREAPPRQSVDEFLLDVPWSALRDELLVGMEPSKPCHHLSGGEWMRVRLARALDDSFLILDEPTNDLDRDGRKIVMRFLKSLPSGALIISHDRECLSLCEEVLELSLHGLAKFGGGWEEYETARDDERTRLGKVLENAKRERDQARSDRAEQIARQEKRNRRGKLAAERGGMPKILIGARKRRAEVTTGKVDASTWKRTNEAVRDAYAAYRELKIDPVMYVDLVGQPIASQKLVAQARGFNVCFGDWIYRRDLDFAWYGNIRLAFKGANGSGKSTLIKALLGEPLHTRGELRSGRLRALYLDQRCESLDDAKSVLDNVREVSRLDESEVRNGLAKLLFAKDTVFQAVGTLSGGERLRAALAKGLLASDKPELLILDEPTNNLDLVNIQFLEKLLAQFRGALIVISHDEIFLEKCGVTETFWLP